MASYYPAEDPWTPLVLSLDGGGIRGYSSLLILENIMVEIDRLENEKDGIQSSIQASNRRLPCHYFDYVVGTSTGGLIAIMIGRLRMNVEGCKEAYKTLGTRVFGNPRWLSLTKYDARVLEDVVRQVVRNNCNTHGSHCAGNDPFRQHDYRDDRETKTCRTVVLAMKEPGPLVSNIYLFRSYEHTRKFYPHMAAEHNPGDPTDARIYEVARATSAAPLYFKEATIDTRYRDGGLGANNPSHHAFHEVRQMRHNMHDPSNPKIGIFVSIGTGRSNRLARWGSGLSRVARLMKHLRKSITDPHPTHVNMQGDTNNGTDPPYYRFSVHNGLEDMKLDEWKTKKRNGEIEKLTISTVHHHTTRYLTGVVAEDNEDVPSNIRRCAEILVDYRRRRMTDQERWETFLNPPQPYQAQPPQAQPPQAQSLQAQPPPQAQPPHAQPLQA